MNVELLRKVQAKILTEPEHFDMKYWICGTTACIAGHAALMAGYLPTERPTIVERNGVDFFTHYAGADALGLNYAQRERLFFVDDWPTKFRSRYGRASNPRTLARIASNRIDHFIETEGRE